MSDPRVLRAIAHPTRGRILDELGATGPMRAADVGRGLDIPANQASFHLRQLAKYGVIQPAPRPPATSATGSGSSPTSGLPARRTGHLEETRRQGRGLGLPQNKAAWAHRLVDEVWSFKRHKGTFNAIVDQPLRLNKDEAAEFMGEVDEVLAKWADKTRGRSKDRRTYVFYAMIQPYPEEGKDA